MLVDQITVSKVSATAALVNGLVAHYPFNGNALDASGNGHDGTLMGATSTQDRFGNPDSAYIFDGTDDYIDISSVSTFQTNEAKSFFAWVYLPDGVSGAGYANMRSIIDSSPVGIWRTLYIRIEEDLYKPSIAVYNVYLSSDPISHDQWHHVGFTWAPNLPIKLYVDGAFATSSENIASWNTASGNTYIGRQYQNPDGHWFDGKIDDVRIYDRTLSTEEIIALYNLAPQTNLHTLTYTAGANGSISGETSQTVEHGADGSPVEAVADTGYHFTQWSDGSAANPRTDTNVTGDISVTGEFAINIYTVIFDPGTNGIRTGAGELVQEVEHGSAAVAPIVEAAEGWSFTGWSVEFSAVTADLTVIAQYEPVMHTVVFHAGAHGSLAGGDPDVSVTVNYGDSAPTTPAVTPAEGYIFTGWSPTLPATITADAETTAQYSLKTYNLTYMAGANGSISGETSLTVAHGADGSPVEAVADIGYHFTQWSDGSTANPRTDSNVSADISVTAEFAINTYTVTFDPGANGTHTGGGDLVQEVEHGSAAVAPIVEAAEGWTFIGWSADFSAVTEDLTFTAQYEPVTEPIQTQDVYLEPATSSIEAGAEFSVSAFYGTTPEDKTLTGLGIDFFFDSTQLGFQGFANVLSTGLLATEATPQNDTTNKDGNTQTDKYVKLTWMDFGGQWPGSTASFPLKLSDLIFVVLADAAVGGTPINLVASSTATGYTTNFTGASVIVAGPSFTGYYPFPDTGQTKCYDNTSEIPCPQPGEPFYGQDAQYAGPARSYTKLGQNGVELPDTATQADGWIMTRDNVTGLIWEIKTNDGSIHDKYDTYTWYDSDSATNGGNAGTPGEGTDTEDFISTLNATNFGGYSDWRLPTVKELSSLINSRIPSSYPVIDEAWFPHTVSFTYWSSTASANDTNDAWRIDFTGGFIADDNKSSSKYVRAVRGGQSGSSGNLVLNGDGTVTDTVTGLMWQETMASGTYTWQEALAYAEGLTLAEYTDWRLPNRNELQTLVDYSRYNPAIDLLLAAQTVSSYYWSSTTDKDHTKAWIVNFTSGYIGYLYSYGKPYSHYVRAVRAGLSGSSGVPGDINADEVVDLKDAVIVLQILSGMNPSVTPSLNITPDADISGDGKLGIEEVIYILRIIGQEFVNDNDGDGYSEDQGDCDDANIDINPGAFDICEDGIDQDCLNGDEICPQGNSDLYGIYDVTMTIGTCPAETFQITVGSEINRLNEEGYVYIPSSGNYHQVSYSEEGCPATRTIMISDNVIRDIQEGQSGTNCTEYSWRDEIVSTFSINDGTFTLSGSVLEENPQGSSYPCQGAISGSGTRAPDPDDVDNDGDGFTENQGDCNDANPDLNPGAVDICQDDVDQDCNGSDAMCEPFAYNEIVGNTYYGLDEDYGCRYDIEIISNSTFTATEGADTESLTYSIIDGAIHVPDPEGQTDGTDFFIQSGESDYLLLRSDYSGGPFELESGLWDGSNLITDLSFLGNSAEALRDWFLSNGLWEAAITADGRVVHPDMPIVGNWWIKDNIFYFAYPDGECVDYKALKVENNQLYKQTDAPYSILTRWYFNCGIEGVPCLDDIDHDGDGFTENQGDCNDANPDLNPGAVDICGDDIDQDCSGSDLACYTNAVFTSSWIGDIQGAGKAYLIGDGAGAITEYSGIIRSGYGPTPPGGSYQVQPDGSFTMLLTTETGDPDINLSGVFTSTTVGEFGGGVTGSLLKVSDLSACQGTWSGTLTESGTSTVYPVTFSVDANGQVTSFSGFSAPITGKMFSESGKLAAFFKTGDSGSYNQITFDGTLSGDTITGSYGNDSPGDVNGTVSLMIASHSTWYKDTDADGYSDGTTTTQVDRPNGYYLAGELTALSVDCNDDIATIYPGAMETCGDGIDQDCDGNDLQCTPQYSNAVFTGPWIGDIQGAGKAYLIGDGAGAITEYSGIIRSGYGPTPPGGSYQVQPDGSFTMLLTTETGDPDINLSGVFTSTTVGEFGGGVTGSLLKVSDLSACQGTWSGTLTESGTATVYPVTFSVDANGQVTSFTGFSAPVTGKMFSESGKLAAFFKTGDSGSYNQITFDGTLSGDTITGSYGNDSPASPTGSINLTRSASQTGSIVGSWGPGYIDGEYLSLTFYPNSHYIVYHNGIEYGSYTHDNSTGQLNVDIMVDNNGQYGLADSGTPYQDEMFVNGDTLNIYQDGVLDASFERAKSDSSPIVGGWGPGYIDGGPLSLTFYPNGCYIVYHNGVEYGTYTHDNSTGQINLNVIQDSNDQNGLANSGAPYQDEMIVSGDTLNIYQGGVLDASFDRVK
ncbi:DUF1566 domain-containing protein [Thermodesulfobacteriota bacterium]